MLTINKPTLLLDVEKCRKNIDFMIAKARRHKLKLSPHFKTHQSADIGKWFLKEGINSATVSSVSMAKYFAENGWKEIIIAFPINLLELETVEEIASTCSVTLLVTSVESAKALAKCKTQFNIFLEVDCGYGRSGIHFDDQQLLSSIVTIIDASPNLDFKGVYAHSGNTYSSRSVQAIEKTHSQAVSGLSAAKAYFAQSHPDIEITLGDTPACSVSENFEGVAAITPGNFVFYDYTQVQIGSCTTDEIAVALACPVVFKNERKQEIAIYGGGVHLSKDRVDIDGVNNFGAVVKLTETGWSKPLPGCFVNSVSQEHGILTVTKSTFQEFNVGNIVGILPVHSCMTADLMGQYHTLDGKVFEHMNGPKFN